MFDLREPVPSLIVIGSGPIGCELAQAFRRLGSEVTVVDIAPSALPREDPDLAAVVHQQLVAEGIRFHFDTTIANVAGAAGAITATLRGKDGTEQRAAPRRTCWWPRAGGSIPKASASRPPALRSKKAASSPTTSCARRIRTSTSSATSPAATSSRMSPSITPASCCATRSSSCGGRSRRRSIPWCTFTDPELARVGLSETEAKQSNVAHKVYRFPFEEIDRARAEGETEGFAKIVTDPKGKLLGAAIVGPHAGELIAEYGLALTKGMNAKDISGVIHTYPTLASISRRVADQRMKEGLTPTAKTWIKRIFRLQGA